MARWKVEGKSVIVEKGDNLWRIAVDFLGNGNESYGPKYKQLATINNIPNPNLIYVGQVIKLYADGSSSSSTTTSNNSNKPTVNQFGLLSNADNTLFATWTWNRSNTESYKVQWTYDTGDGVWFVGDNKTISVDEDDPGISRQDTFSIPSNARRVRFKVKPISKKKETTSTGSGGSSGNSGIIYYDTSKNSNSGSSSGSSSTPTYYWTADFSDVQTYTDSTPLVTPGVPSVTIDKLELVATLEGIKIPDADFVEFEVVQRYSGARYASQLGQISYEHASVVFYIDPGSAYKVRARALNNKAKEYSDWSDYSSYVEAMPETPVGITTIRANSKTSVYLEWDPGYASDTAKTYDIEYATKEEHFDISDEPVRKTGITTTKYEVTGLTTGTRYFFRVRAVNEGGESNWTSAKPVVIGTKPSAPTTWSSTTTAITGEPLTLFWVHNTEDGSRQTFADIELYVGDQKVPVQAVEFPESEDEDEKEKISSYDIDTSDYPEGTKIQWRVRTAGITNEYGDWSVQRTVDIYAPPTLGLKITDIDGNSLSTVTRFPIYVYALAGPNTQMPIGYQLTVISNTAYETVDTVGNYKMVNPGDQVYSKHFDIQDALLVELSANNIDLENNAEYTVSCTVSMNSGLTAETSFTFVVNWTDAIYSPNAEVGFNRDNLTALIRPYCEDSQIAYYKVDYIEDQYIKTEENLGLMCGEIVKGARTKTSELVYSGSTADGESVYYCLVEEKVPVTDVYMSVYRREFDGSFTELATGLDGAKHTTVVDPHPALDFARYRIVAISKSTGAVSYTDLPGLPVNGKSVVIQWEEEWTNFDVTEDVAMEHPPWTGSLLKLPYNIDVSDNNNSDVALVEYIGRTHPVSYYGTQIGQSATWNVDIDKTDKETFYGLRRLSRWMGDVYVREPSGSGYWAHISVSFSQKHRELTIPVTLKITRVEGGV